MEQWLEENLPDDGMTSVNELNRSLWLWKALTECDLTSQLLTKITQKEKLKSQPERLCRLEKQNSFAKVFGFKVWGITIWGEFNGGESGQIHL